MNEKAGLLKSALIVLNTHLNNKEKTVGGAQSPEMRNLKVLLV
jgi:hypothetical protein